MVGPVEGGWEERRWKPFRGGEPHRREANHLSTCILERAPDNDCAREFIEHRFRFPLSNYRSRSTTAAGVHIAINLLSAAFGLAIASIAASGGDSPGWKAAIVAIGLAVGVLSVTNQIIQPGRRNLAFARTWLELRAQGWQYVWALGDYGPRSTDSKAERKIWDLFVTRVINAQQEAEKIAEPGGNQASGVQPPDTTRPSDASNDIGKNTGLGGPEPPERPPS